MLVEAVKVEKVPRKGNKNAVITIKIRIHTKKIFYHKRKAPTPKFA